jgi:hypothetical protein
VCRLDAVPDASLYWQGEGATGAVWVDRGQPNDTGESGPGDVGAGEDRVGEVGDDSITSIDLASGLEYRHHLR